MQSHEEKLHILAQVMLDVQDELSEELVKKAIQQVKGIVPDEYVDAAGVGILAVAIGLLYARMSIKQNRIDKVTLEHVLTCDDCLRSVSSGVVNFLPVNGLTLAESMGLLAAQGVRKELRPKKTPTVDINIPGVKS